jgi:hypothetical protein
MGPQGTLASSVMRAPGWSALLYDRSCCHLLMHQIPRASTDYDGEDGKPSPASLASGHPAGARPRVACPTLTRSPAGGSWRRCSWA